MAAAPLQIFEERQNCTLRVFCPNPSTVISTFETYLPDAVKTIHGEENPDQRAELSWNLPGYEYYAYLPKDRDFDGHLLGPLKHHTPRLIKRDQRWYVDDETRDLWRSLDINLTYTIDLIDNTLYHHLNHYEPPQAIRHGFTCGHRSKNGLNLSLNRSKHAFIHRLAYLSYLISLRYNWKEEPITSQPWRDKLEEKCRNSWIDSVWAAIRTQWETRNFIGVAVRPTETLIFVEWLRAAFRFGVPIWVSFPNRTAYNRLGATPSVMEVWIPEVGQVQIAMQFTTAGIQTTPPSGTPTDTLLESPTDPPPAPPLVPPPAPPLDPPQTNPGSISPPDVIPQNSRWYESWEVFFRKRDKAFQSRLEGASAQEKQRWEDRKANAAAFHPPGNSGALVYDWELCESGGFFRTLQTRQEAADSWEFYLRGAMVFDALENTWDHCEFKWSPAVESGPPDDLDSDDGHVMEPWYTEPDSPATLPDNNPPMLDFMYYRYGFLSTEPTSTVEIVLKLDPATAHRIIGLEAPSAGQELPHLNSFISSIIQGKIPPGHCDLCPTCPVDEGFTSAQKTSIFNTVFWSLLPKWDQVFTFVDSSNNLLLLVVHEPLSVLQMARAGFQPQLDAKLRYLLHNGCRFTMLYPHPRPSDPPRFCILAFPTRREGWKATVEDYRAYMSRLKTFFLERPHVVAAAFCRGGIAWRIAREVLGIEGSVEAVLGAYPDQGSTLNTSQGRHWFHEPDEGEWFYLIGGYEVWTGLWSLPHKAVLC